MRVLVIVACVLFLGGCITNQKVDWSATGGSRADATVEMGYQSMHIRIAFHTFGY